MGSVDVMRQLRRLGLPDGELATRAGLARETVARWRSGAQRPSLDALEKLAAASGAQLEVRLVPADAEHVALVGDQLDLGPTDRLKALLRPRGARTSCMCRDCARCSRVAATRRVRRGSLAPHDWHRRVPHYDALQRQLDRLGRLIERSVEPPSVSG
jgi:transcriptional regulator with XRE-family HTH domain